MLPPSAKSSWNRGGGAKRKDLSDHYRRFREMPPPTRRLIVITCHKLIPEVDGSFGGEIKTAISLEAEKWPAFRRSLTQIPTGLSFSTARRRDLAISAALGNPLVRESLVTLVWPLSMPEGSSFFAARTPRLPRILQEH